MKGPINQHKELAMGGSPNVRRDGPQPKPSAYKAGGRVKPPKDAPLSDRDVRPGKFPRSRGT